MGRGDVIASDLGDQLQLLPLPWSLVALICCDEYDLDEGVQLTDEILCLSIGMGPHMTYGYMKSAKLGLSLRLVQEC